VNPPGNVFVNPSRFVNGNTALLVSGMANIGIVLVWADAGLIDANEAVETAHASRVL